MRLMDVLAAQPASGRISGTCKNSDLHAKQTVRIKMVGPPPFCVLAVYLTLYQPLPFYPAVIH